MSIKTDCNYVVVATKWVHQLKEAPMDDTPPEYQVEAN